MKEWAELIRSIADLLWPILFFIVLLIFRKNISDLLTRVKKGKLFGQELELEESLKRLETSTAVAASQIPATGEPPLTVGKESRDPQASDKILELAASSPKAALMLLASEIEKRLRVFMATSGHHTNLRDPSPSAIAAYLGQVGWLTKSMVDTIHNFWKTRNQIVHGHEASPDQVLRAIDSGMTILKALEAIPSEVNIVYHTGVPIFSDRECHEQRLDVRGLILETTSPGRTVVSFRIFPTTRTNYQKGKQVTWEWDMSKTWDASWYRDPDTNFIKQAWSGSTEFIGRHVEEV